MTGGFAELYASRDAAVRPAQATPPPVEGELPAWAARLSPAARRVVLDGLQGSRHTDALDTTQEDLDDMTDDEKWEWAEKAVHAEKTRAAALTEAEALQNQTTIMEGHQ